MRKTNVICAVSLMAATFLGVVAAAEVTDSPELGAFSLFEAETESPYEADQFVPTPHCTAATQSTPSTDIDNEISDRPGRQFYVSSILGGSFFALTADDTPSSSLTAGGAMGVAVDLSYRVFGLGWTFTSNDLAYGFLRTEVLLSLCGSTSHFAG